MKTNIKRYANRGQQPNPHDHSGNPWLRPEEQQWVDQVVNVTMKAWQQAARNTGRWLSTLPFSCLVRLSSHCRQDRTLDLHRSSRGHLSEGAVRGVAEGWNALSKERSWCWIQRPGGLTTAASGFTARKRGLGLGQQNREVGEILANTQIKAAWTEIQHATDMTLRFWNRWTGYRF